MGEVSPPSAHLLLQEHSEIPRFEVDDVADLEGLVLSTAKVVVDDWVKFKLDSDGKWYRAWPACV